MKHTPGPWRARKGFDPQWHICGPNGDFHIIATTNHGNDEANATLLAAAPDMKEALKKVITCASTPDAVMELVRLALAKSEGKPGGIL